MEWCERTAVTIIEGRKRKEEERSRVTVKEEETPLESVRRSQVERFNSGVCNVGGGGLKNEEQQKVPRGTRKRRGRKEGNPDEGERGWEWAQVVWGPGHGSCVVVAGR